MSDDKRTSQRPKLSLSRRLLIGAIIWSIIAVVGGITAFQHYADRAAADAASGADVSGSIERTR